MLPAMRPRTIGCTVLDSPVRSVTAHAAGHRHEVGATVRVADGVQDVEQVTGVVVVVLRTELCRAVRWYHLVIAGEHETGQLVAGAVLAAGLQQLIEPL